MCVSEDDSETEGRESEQEEESSSDYYAWSSQGGESSEEDCNWTPDIEFDESDDDDEINEVSFTEVK